MRLLLYERAIINAHKLFNMNKIFKFLNLTNQLNNEIFISISNIVNHQFSLMQVSARSHVAWCVARGAQINNANSQRRSPAA